MAPETFSLIFSILNHCSEAVRKYNNSKSGSAIFAEISVSSSPPRVRNKPQPANQVNPFDRKTNLQIILYCLRILKVNTHRFMFSDISTTKCFGPRINKTKDPKLVTELRDTLVAFTSSILSSRAFLTTFIHIV